MRKLNIATTKSGIKSMRMHILFLYIRYKTCEQIAVKINKVWTENNGSIFTSC